MSFLLSIILCFALALGGVGGLPAEPETATVWTIRNVTLENDSDVLTLEPEARIVTAVGTDRALFHFEVIRDGKTLLPLSAEVSGDALRFALGDSGRAYMLSDEDFWTILEMDEEDRQVIDILSKLFTSYGSLLGMMYGDQEEVIAYSQTVMNALLAACGGEFEPVEIELDGKTLSGQQVELDLTVESAFTLLDTLHTCGIDSLETLLDALLEIINLRGDEIYPDFASLAALAEEEELDISLPFAISFAEADGLSYALVECDFDISDDSYMLMREEIVTRGEQTDVEMTMNMQSDGVSADYKVTAQMIGPLNAPEEIHMDYDVEMTTAIPYDGGDDVYTSYTTMGMTLDVATEDELQDAYLTMEFDSDGIAGQISISSIEVREDDGSVTASVDISVSGENQDQSVSFELNRAEAPVTDYFDGAEIYEITADAFDSEETPAFMDALGKDSIRLSADLKALSADLEALMSFGEGEIEDYDYDDDYDDDEDSDYDVEGFQILDSLEDAAELFDGDMPDFTAPDGYEIGEIWADSTYLSIEYSDGENSFELISYGYPSDTYAYAFDGSALTPIDGSVVQLGQYEDGTVSSAAVYPPDGGVELHFYFYGPFTQEDVAAVLSGLK